MSDHESLQSNLAALAADRLGHDDRLELEAHLAQCADCAEILVLAQEVARLTPHPTVRELRGYALDRSTPKSASIAEHVPRCVTCKLEVEAWRRRRRPQRWATVAAGLAAAGLALWFWLDRAVVLPGSQALTFSAALRGSTSQPSATVDARRAIDLWVKWMPVESLDEVGALNLTIASPGGLAVWTQRLEAPQVAELLRERLGLSAVVPAGTLAPGLWEVALSRAAHPGESPVVHGRFIVD